MWKYKLCLATSRAFPVPVCEQIKLFYQIGFDAFFTEWKAGEDLTGISVLAKELGMIFQSVHAPFGKSRDMWHGDTEKANEAVEELKECIDECAKQNVPLMVAHAFIGFEEHNPTVQGLENYGKVIEYARKKGVKIAFENTEGEEYLAALMNEFSECENVGFCWDTGHEMCYNRSQDLLKLYGDKLLCTHINDNLGIRDFNGRITYIDDLHLLPFDGIADWDDIASRLDACGYDDIMTFELSVLSKPNRHENDVYRDMKFESYIAECYKRACRVAAKRKGYKKIREEK